MCNKKSFKSLEAGIKRAEEINIEIKKNKTQKNLLRAYVCEKCNKVHLTSKTKKEYSKIATVIRLRNKKREERFIHIETQYYENLFGMV